MNEQDFLEYIKSVVEYWKNVPGIKEDALDGLAFTILNLFDGTHGDCPALTITVKETGEIVNPDGCLHEGYFS